MVRRKEDVDVGVGAQPVDPPGRGARREGEGLAFEREKNVM